MVVKNWNSKKELVVFVNAIGFWSSLVANMVLKTKMREQLKKNSNSSCSILHLLVQGTTDWRSKQLYSSEDKVNIINVETNAFKSSISFTDRIDCVLKYNWGHLRKQKRKVKILILWHPNKFFEGRINMILIKKLLSIDMY